MLEILNKCYIGIPILHAEEFQSNYLISIATVTCYKSPACVMLINSTMFDLACGQPGQEVTVSEVKSVDVISQSFITHDLSSIQSACLICF